QPCRFSIPRRGRVKPPASRNHPASPALPSRTRKGGTHERRSCLADRHSDPDHHPSLPFRRLLTSPGPHFLRPVAFLDGSQLFPLSRQSPFASPFRSRKEAQP